MIYDMFSTVLKLFQVVAVSQDFEMVADLGADVVLDHTDPEYLPTLRKLASFDVIFDFAGLENQSVTFMELLRPWSNAKLVTLMSPFLRSTDQDGLVPGSIKTLVCLATKNIQTVVNQNGTTFRYGYFIPNPSALNTIAKLVEDKKVKAVVQEVFKLDHLPAAYEKVAKGNLNGKIVVDHSWK